MVHNKYLFIFLAATILTLSISCSLIQIPEIEMDFSTTPENLEHDIPVEPPTPIGADPEQDATPYAPNPPSSSTTLHPDGPWLLLQTGEALLAVNPDGSGPIPLISTGNWVGIQDLAAQTSPSGDKLVFFTATDIRTLEGLSLNILTLPDQQVTTLTELISPQYVPDPSAEWGDPALMAAHTLVDVASFAWSPDGSQLAFMGILEGETSDLYLHDFNTGDTTQLTDGPSQGIRPSWSPDGRWIVHTGVSSLGTGAGFGMEGIWAAAADGSGVQSLYTIDAASGDEIIHGWISPQEFVVSTWTAVFGEQELRSYNIETGIADLIVDSSFTSSALDTRLGTVLYYTDRYSAQNPSDSGFYEVHVETGTRTNLTDTPIRFKWDSISGSYLIITETRTYAMTPRGDETEFPAEIRTFPVFQAGSDRWAAAQGGPELVPGVWVTTPDGSLSKLSDEPYTNIFWTSSGGLITFGNPGLAYAPPGLESFAKTGTDPLIVMDAAWLDGSSR